MMGFYVFVEIKYCKKNLKVINWRMFFFVCKDLYDYVYMYFYRE